MLAHLLSLPLWIASPPSDAARSSEAPEAVEAPTESAPTDASAPPSEGESEFGPLVADPNAPTDDSPAGGGYGTLAPLPNYGDAGTGAGEGTDPAPAPQPVKKPKPTGFEEPEDFGPFYEPEPASEVVFPGDARRPDRDKPFASVGGGVFCFVEDSVCGASLIADADVGVGLNIINSDRGLDVPYTQFRVRGGVTLRPLRLGKHKRWHPWGVGAVASWSLASGSITANTRNASETLVEVNETEPIRSWRIGLVNQVWLSQKRNALHLDFTLGGVNSTVLDAKNRYWGTHAEVALGFGGWGGLYMAGDFLDQDTRVFFGMRGHGIATGPLIALIVLGLVAGGVAL